MGQTADVTLRQAEGARLPTPPSAMTDEELQSKRAEEQRKADARIRARHEAEKRALQAQAQIKTPHERAAAHAKEKEARALARQRVREFKKPLVSTVPDSLLEEMKHENERKIQETLEKSGERIKV